MNVESIKIYKHADLDKGTIVCSNDAYEPMMFFVKNEHVKQKKIEELEKKLAEAKKALNELGHYGIDFGYGPYDCNVAQVAQDCLKSLEENQNDSEGQKEGEE